MSKIYISLIVPCVGAIPIIVGLARKINWNKQAGILFFYLCLAGLFNIIAKVTAGSNNLPYLHLYTVLEFTILCFYLKSFSKDRRLRLFLNSILIGFILLSIWYAFIKESLFVFNKVPRFLDSFIISVLCLYYLLKDLGSSVSNLSRFQFLTLAGLLFYYGSSSVLFGLSDELLKAPKNVADLLWNIHATLLLLMYILFTFAYDSLKTSENGR